MSRETFPIDCGIPAISARLSVKEIEGFQMSD
jgi:hypothetical protein